MPERGWGAEEAVRVCRDCYGPLATKASKSRGGFSAPTKAPPPVAPQGPKDDNINARRYGEKVVSVSASFFGAVLDYPLYALKDSARPAYWIPDEVNFVNFKYRTGLITGRDLYFSKKLVLWFTTFIPD